MAEVKRWSGNDTTSISLYDNELDKLAEFVANHEKNYIYGEGKIGKALGHYFVQSGFDYEGFVTSENISSYASKIKKYKTGLIIGVSDRYIPEILPIIQKHFTEKDVFFLSSDKREHMGNLFSIDNARDKFWINIFTNTQCNLNCKSCSTFAPICAEDKYELEEFEKDLKQIKTLKIPNINYLNFTGGEPFLHPQLLELFACAREIFPEIPINCYTNGLRLNAVTDEYLQCIKDLRVTLIITEYPVRGLDLSKGYGRLESLGVTYNVIYSEGQKYFSKRPLNEKKDTPRHKFYYCPRYKMCDSLFLYKGHMYKCIYAFTNEYFNQTFGTEFKREKGDDLDIYNIKADDIYTYLISRIPYCSYCSPIEELVPWELSEKKIEEWT